ncbi:MAG: hypothetical protein AB7F98_14505 [Novosphingobium sp.]
MTHPNQQISQLASIQKSALAPRNGMSRSGLVFLATFGLLAACSQSKPAGNAEQTSAAKSGGAMAVSPSNQALDDAASAAENLIEAVLANDASAGDKAYSDLQTAMKGLTLEQLGKDSAIIGSLNQSVNDGWQADDRSAAAMAAVSLYSRLQQAKDWTGADVPMAVAMLDHAGFKSELLAAQDPINWAELTKTAEEARGSLATLEPMLDDANLKQVTAGIVEHLSVGVKDRDLQRVQSAARDLLAVVDLLEQQFQRQAKSPQMK